MPVENILDFAAGDPVPEWLLYCEPNDVGSVQPIITFSVGGSIIEANGRYWFIPEILGPDSFIKLTDGKNISIGASNLDVVLPLRTMTTEVKAT